jgi:N-acetylneuraminate synthase
LPTTVVSEIGINHQGSLDTAFKLIRAAAAAGVDAVKFQKREPRVSTPKGLWEATKETPWGPMAYIDYRTKMEFWLEEFARIDGYCKTMSLPWFASAWDVESVEFLKQFDMPYIKVPSAKATDVALLKAMRNSPFPVVLSTGMCELDDVRRAVEICQPEVILHCTSTYPCPPEDLNLRAMLQLSAQFPECSVGYSGHETGLAPTLASVAMGAKMVERHITLDRTMWGSDQSASVEPGGFKRLVKDIRLIECAMGDGQKHAMPSEAEAIKRLRGDASVG